MAAAQPAFVPVLPPIPEFDANEMPDPPLAGGANPGGQPPGVPPQPPAFQPIAQPPAQPPVGVVNVVDTVQSSKLPTFHGNSQDSMNALAWVKHIERSQVAQRWTDPATHANAINALRDQALGWYHTSENTKEHTSTWSDFRFCFLREFGSKGDFKGNSHMDAMLTPRKRDEDLRDFYIRIVLEFQKWKDTFIPRSPPTTHDQAMPRSIRNLPGYYDLNLAILQEPHFKSYNEGVEDLADHLISGVFYAGLDDDLRTHLQAKQTHDIVDMRLACYAHEASQKAKQGNVSAIHGKTKRASTGPPTTKKNGQERKKNIICFYCNKPNHSQLECRTRIRENGEMKKPPAKKVNEVASKEQNQDQQPQAVNSFHLNY